AAVLAESRMRVGADVVELDEEGAIVAHLHGRGRPPEQAPELGPPVPARAQGSSPPTALRSACAPPTTGSSSDVPPRSTVSSVPGVGQSVKSRSLEKIMRPMRWPAGITWS